MYRAIYAQDYDPTWLFKKVKQTAGCWFWQGSKYQNGYGKYGSRGIMAHRIFYTLFKGEVPTDMALDHLCRERTCVNPEHLEIVTMVENVMRGESTHAKNARKTHCKKGHELTGANLYIHPTRGHRQCRTCRTLTSNNFHKKEGK